MNVSRRSLLLTTSLATAALSVSALPGNARAWQGTPAATPADEPLPPEVIFERLLTSTVSTPLFPSDTGNLVITEWVDTGDDDLKGVVGAVLVQAEQGADDEPLIVGACIVHPTIQMAEDRIASQMSGASEGTLNLFGSIGTWHSESGAQPSHISEPDSSYSLVALVSGTVIVSAFGEGAGQQANNHRALANLAGMLDHLRITTSAE